MEQFSFNGNPYTNKELEILSQQFGRILEITQSDGWKFFERAMDEETAKLVIHYDEAKTLNDFLVTQGRRDGATLYKRLLDRFKDCKRQIDRHLSGIEPFPLTGAVSPADPQV